MLKIDASDMLAWAQEMGAAEAKAKRELIRAGNAIAKHGAASARSFIVANNSIVSGHLLSSIRALPASLAGNTLTMEWGAAEDKPAIWVEYGRGPVTARRGGVLRFTTKDGRYVVTKSVGPAKPRPFLKPSSQATRPVARKLLAEAIMRAIRR